MPSESLVLIREVLEIGAYISLFKKDMNGFINNMSHLKVYYHDIKSISDPSSRMYQLIGLELLRCLVQHQLSEFHTLLEYLPHDALLTNSYVRASIVLEQCMMEGSFQKALEACTKIPGPEYQYLVECMIDSLRDELADCFEVAYTALPWKAAIKLLFCKKEQDLNEFVKKRGWDYQSIEDYIYFPKYRSLSDTTKNNMELLLERDLFIARQMEKIV